MFAFDNQDSRFDAQDIDIYEIYSKTEVHVLICDDDELDRERLVRLMQKIQLRFNITECASGQEALDYLSTTRVDCLLLDYSLGDMSGIELLDAMKQLPDTNTPTIMITGFGDEMVAVQVMQAGAYDYLNKHSISLKTLCNVIESTLKRAALEKNLAYSQAKVRYMSQHDELTGLPNRYVFFNFLEQTIINSTRTDSEFSILMLDLNLFKQVNDSFGHAAGDIVLRMVGERLSCLFRKSDMVARIGGDEFACILPGVSEVDAVAQFCDKVANLISQPVVVGDKVVQIGVSIGVVVFPEHGRDAHTLLSNADYMMYSAKQHVCNFMIFDRQFMAKDTPVFNISLELPKAIQAGELYLEYQPKINLANGQLAGVEALVRWKSNRGQISPVQFIPTIERTKLIENLTYHTITEAFQQCACWTSEHLFIPIAINISAKMLDQTELIKWLEYSLQQFSIDPSMITLEITETALSASSLRAKDTINQLINMGFKISLDDFGSGFTSFRYIREIAISEIKIDQSYIHDIEHCPRARSIVRSLSSLADELNIKIVAEGIENVQQYNTLSQMGNFNGQGFYLERPMQAHLMAPWLSLGTAN